ncbi:MAG: glycosyltransferase family 2 protein [Candidatus Sumerlaeota bacterium]|nr:glycosyltransferase family 2 protein [Candidatus Sumerlaeota bacterium]
MKIWIAVQVLIAAGLIWQLARAWRNGRRLLRPNPRPSAQPTAIQFSLCISLRDEDQRLDQLLMGIAVQDYARYEALVYDDGLSPQAAERLRLFAKRVSKIAVVSVPQGRLKPQGRAAALDVLARQARGDCLVFLGGKHELHRGSLRLLASLWKDARADAVCLYALGASKSMAQRLFDPFREHRLATCASLASLEGRGEGVATEGGAWIVGRDAFLQAGGFGVRPESAEAEMDLVRRLKAAGRRARMADARSIVHTCRPSGFLDIFQADQRALRRFATPAQLWSWFVAGTLLLHALPLVATVAFLWFKAFGLWQFWSTAALVGLGWLGRWAARRPFRSSRLSFALHPLLIAYETALAVDLSIRKLRRKPFSWKGRAWG